MKINLYQDQFTTMTLQKGSFMKVVLPLYNSLNNNLHKAISLLLILLFVNTLNTSGQNLVNANSTPEAKSLRAFLGEVYGKKILSGQCNEKWLPLIQSKTGKQPAILALDFDGICPSQGGNKGAETAIDYVKNKGGIVQFQWHWISPNADGDYYSSNFKLGDALNNPNGSSYKNMMRDIDLVAGEIKKMQDAGVPIIWRPLHESEGAWFWWGMSGKDALVKLYRLMYDRFTNYHKLNNIIWLWNSYGSDKGNWYPGDDVCDIIAWDYETSSSWSQYQSLFGNKGKLFGLAEVGKLTDPNSFAAKPWSFFICWDYMIQDPAEPNIDPGKRAGQNPTSWTKSVYADSRTINLSDLPQYNVYGRFSGAFANAGVDQTISITSGTSAQVTLDGSASKTTAGSITSYVWKENGVQIATGVKPLVTLSTDIHVITLTVTDSNGKSNSDEVIVAIKLPNLALNKPVTVSSTEVGVNTAIKAVDGKATTRWSSLYTDPQWIYVDLQNSYAISSVILNWESASAKNYTVDVSDDAKTWTTIATKSNMAADARIDKISALSAICRYVRVTGTVRNTTFGYSLFEFEVNGILADGPKADAGQDITVTDTYNAGFVAVKLDGSKSTDSNGTIASYSWSENGIEIAQGISPTVNFTVAGSPHTVVLKITDNNLKTSTDAVVVTVKPYVMENLALKKLVTASSIEPSSNNIAANAVDGNVTTRWSSAYADLQTFQVDLGASFSIKSVVLNWEAASGKDYKVEVSADAITWTTLVTKSAMIAGPRIDNLTGLSGVGRYVRLTGTARNTQWGFSLFEFEVYGGSPVIIHPTGVTLSPSSATINLRPFTFAPITQQLTASVLPSDATNTNVSFFSGNTAVATVDAKGLVTPIAEGTAIITVKTEDGGFIATSTIEVVRLIIPVNSVDLSPVNVDFNAVNQTKQLTAIVSPLDATDQAVVYSSSDNSIAIVDANGLVSSVSKGSAWIYVTTNDGGKKDSVAVTVTISSCTLLSRFAVPGTSALASIDNVTYPYIFVLGAGGPGLSNVTSGVVQWSLPNKGLWQFAFNTNNGAPAWYVNLNPATTQTFGSSSPACVIKGSGITGLDGDYWATMDGSNFVLVAKSGTYAIYFSLKNVQPSGCPTLKTTSVSSIETSGCKIYPTILDKTQNLTVSVPENMMNTMLTIHDLNGRLVKQLMINSSEMQVSIDESFGSGMYFVKINNSINQKIIVR